MTKEWREKNRERCRAYGRAHYARNRTAVLAKHKERRTKFPGARRNDIYKCLYGITVAQYETLKYLQNNHCKLCGRPPKTNRLHVDHDHATGAIRGLLCTSCNATLIGVIEKNPGLYRKIGDYLGLR